MGMVKLPDTFVRATLETLPRAAVRDSRLWMGRLLRFDPYGLPAARSFHVARAGTVDLLRHEFLWGRFPIDIVESRTFLVLRVLKWAPEILTPALGTRILRVDELPPPSACHPLDLAHWSERIDRGTEDGHLWFHVWKKERQSGGLPDALSWFDFEFRVRFAA